MVDILRAIDTALERRGISARAASIRAQGAPELIRDMRRGHVPSVTRLRALCEALDLEFYVGPPRWRRAEDGGALPDVPLRALERTVQDLAQLTVAAGGNPISDDLWPVIVARRASELPSADKDPLDADARGASMEDRRDRVWISRKWLEGRGVDPAHCAVVRIRDGAMEPALPNGSAVLIDAASTDWEPPCVIAVQLGEDIVLRRAAVAGDGGRLLACDHPGWADDPLPADALIVGRARWLGHWLD